MLAAVDVGSNTLRLLLGDPDGGRVTPFLYERRITRLGGGFTAAKGLSPEARTRTLVALHEVADICREHSPEKIRAVGTAALRSAVNGVEFVAAVRSETGIPLEIITGNEEAQLTASGVLSALDPVPSACLTIDIGGGSTEFILTYGGRMCAVKSHPLGVVRLMEDHADRDGRAANIDPVIDSVIHETAAFCRRYGIEPGTLAVVGTAGTVTTLAALDQEMAEYDWRQINNYQMPFTQIQSWYDRLRALTVVERERLPGMEEGRGDLIIAGIEILLCLLTRLEVGQLIVSDFGILEGVLLSMAGNNISTAQN